MMNPKVKNENADDPVEKQIVDYVMSSDDQYVYSLIFML